MRDLIDLVESGMVEGPMVDGRIVPRLASGEPPQKLFRLMSSTEYEAGVARGVFAPRDRIHASIEPHLEYCEPGDQNVLVSIDYDDADGWKAKYTMGLGVVAITDEPIPAARVHLIARGDRRTIERALG